MNKVLPFTESYHDPEKEREKNDFYVTPDDAIEAILERVQLLGNVFEPACGDGAISEKLIEYGYDVYSSDLVDRGYGDAVQDFLTLENDFVPPAWKGENFDIITNPPFKHAQEFVYTAMSLKYCRRALFFSRIGFLESKKRKIMFERTPFCRIYVMSWRVSMWKKGEVKKGGKNMPTAWFLWDKKYKGKPEVEWI